MRRWSLIVGLLVLAGGVGPAGASPAPPQVVVTRPASGALLTRGQPTFAGTASDTAADTGQVTLNVYAGSSADRGSVPAEVLHSSVTNGRWSATSLGLADGDYTVTASEPDTSGQIGTSPPVTFGLYNATPELSLDGPATPVDTTPTFTGRALTDPGDAGTVQLEIYPGTSTDATPVAILSGDVAAGGGFSIQVLPGLARGTYTAVAAQQEVTHEAYSPPVTVQITAGRAALSVGSPAAGASEPQTGVGFSGGAGDAYGDGPRVNLILYRGAGAAGRPVGRESVTRSGTNWTERWPTPLALGTYTLVASQADVSGAAAQITRTFAVVPPGSLSGPITVSRSGRVAARLACLSGAGTCVGDVLVLTARAFAPAYGGPHGPLALMFAHFSVPAGQSAALDASLGAPALAALKRAGAVPLVVTVAYPVAGHLQEVSRRTLPVRVGA